MVTQEQPGNARPAHDEVAAAENPAAAGPPEEPSNADDPPDEGLPRTFSTLLNTVTGFMSLAGKEWFSSLLNQPTAPPFTLGAKFDGLFDRVIRLVVIVILLTAVVVGSVGVFASKTAALEIARTAIGILILAFLTAIIYSVFAYLCGVRVCENQNRRKLTVAQILYAILYIFVPWIPIIAFLRVTASPASSTPSPSLLLFLTICLYVSVIYMILNFAKALRRLTECSRLRIWISILLPILLVLMFLMRSPAPASVLPG